MHDYSDPDNRRLSRSERLIPNLPLNITPMDPDTLEAWKLETESKLGEITSTPGKKPSTSKREWLRRINNYFGRVRLEREKEEQDRKTP